MAGLVLTLDVVEKVARIAHIQLSCEEKNKFLVDMRDVLSAFRTLDEADVSGIEPAFHPVESNDVLRDDVEEPSLSQEEALANTPHKENGYFREPRAI